MSGDFLLIPRDEIMKSPGFKRHLCIRHPQYDEKLVEMIWTVDGILIREVDERADRGGLE